MTTVALRHARVRYGPLEALHGIGLTAPGPGLTVLLGRNGSGRTTALRALAGTVPLSGGAVLWDGADVTRVPAYERARRGMCLVPERQAVFGSLTVRENLELAARDPTVALDAYPQLRPLLQPLPGAARTRARGARRRARPGHVGRGRSPDVRAAGRARRVCGARRAAAAAGPAGAARDRLRTAPRCRRVRRGGG